MKHTAKQILCGLIACAMLALTGCGSTVDNRDDPLSGYSVNSLLPFGTRNPELIESPTPQPTATAAAVTRQPGATTIAPLYTPQPTATTAPTGIPASNTAASYTRLEPGDTGDDVTRLQNRLIQLGYLTGTADGRYGTQTQNAIKLFQKALGISQTGIANVSLQERLFSINAPVYSPSAATSVPAQTSTVNSVASYPTLVRGDEGDAVLTLQRRLQELGYLSGLADGKFGGQTESARNAWGTAVACTEVRDDPYDFDGAGAKKTVALRKDCEGLPEALESALVSGVIEQLRAFDMQRTRELGWIWLLRRHVARGLLTCAHLGGLARAFGVRRGQNEVFDFVMPGLHLEEAWHHRNRRRAFRHADPGGLRRGLHRSGARRSP